MVGRDSDKIDLRVPAGMRDRIKAAAEKNNRSMNAEIVKALEIRFPTGPTSAEVFFALVEASNNIEDEEEFQEMLDTANEHAQEQNWPISYHYDGKELTAKMSTGIKSE